MTLTRRDRYLLVALAVVALAASWRWVEPVVRQLAASAGVQPTHRIVSPVPSRQVEVVHLADLEIPVRDYSPNRNIFRLGQRPKTPPPPPVAPPPPVRQPTTVVQPPPPRTDSKPVPPPVDVKLLGVFGPEHRRVAVFKDKNGEEIFNALENELLRDKFRVTEIGYQSVELEFVGFPDAPPARLKIGG